MLSDKEKRWESSTRFSRSLNAPFGARCLLTLHRLIMIPHTRGSRNSPYGAHLGGLLENVACNSALTSSGFEIIALIFRGFRESLKCVRRELHARVWVARRFLT